jgi:esterase/lipase superfamily enzyme
MLEGIETWVLKLLGDPSVTAEEVAAEIRSMLRTVEGVQVDRLLFEDGPRIRVMLRRDTEPEVSAALRAYLGRHLEMAVEIVAGRRAVGLNAAIPETAFYSLTRRLLVREFDGSVLDLAGTTTLGAVDESVPQLLTRLPPSHVVVRVFYATDRHESMSTYGKERSLDGEIALGECEVSIPRDHRMGMLERPSILRLEFREDPEKHVVLHKTVPLENQQFWQVLSSKTQKSTANEAFVFVHGYCTTFEDSVLRTAQIAYDLGFDGAPISYSWPSQGELADYPQDETNAQWSVPHLKSFLQELAQYSGAKTIHIIAHSMGNRIVSHALQLLYAESQTKACRMRHIVLTAPDIDADTFKQMAEAIKSLADRVTLYCSAHDKALALSKRFHGYPRLGETTLVIEGIDTIDASAVDTSFIGHSYYGENRSILSDIFWLLKSNKPPTDRFGIKVIQQGASIYYAFRT